MVNLTINDTPVSVKPGLSILEAAGSAGIEILNLCYLKSLNEISACRVCCVEVEGEGKLVPSCNNVVREGMVIHTNSPRVREARRTNVELILSQHDVQCATCVRSGTCQLQKVATDLGVLQVPYTHDLAQGKKTQWTKTFPLYREVNKCIKCMRCVQVCDKVQSLSVWDVSGSGSRTTVDVSGYRFIKEADCALCGQCITHCPTGTTPPKPLPRSPTRIRSRSCRSRPLSVPPGLKRWARRQAARVSSRLSPLCGKWVRSMCSTPRFPPT